jgi:hypothetical protein
MLKHANQFMPVTTEWGFYVLVSTGFQRDVRFKDPSSDEMYLNPFVEGTKFNRDRELITDKSLIRNLQEAKNRVHKTALRKLAIGQGS